MDGLDMIYTRRSVRTFQPTPIPEEICAQLIKAAHLAPTGHNIQPWKCIVIHDADVKRQLAEEIEYGRYLADVPLCIAVFCKQTRFYLEDGCAATQNILLAARYFGIGSCWISADHEPYSERVRTLCGQSEEYRPVSLIALGYPVTSDVFVERTINNMGYSIV
jgi:nitroreductase